MKGPLQAYWQSRPPRERAIYGTGGSLLLLLFLYTSVWMPLQDSLEELHKSVPRLRQEDAQMVAEAREAVRLKALPPPDADNLSPQDAIAAAAKEAGVKPAQYQLAPAANNRINITIARIDFDVWLNWLRILQAKHHLRFQEGTIEPAGKGGMVKVKGTLSIMDGPR
jgi:type II secretory pathway component PulM